MPNEWRMRRRSTIFSFPGLVILVILLTGLGLMLWRQGGLAFSPGQLSAVATSDASSGDYASHADFEGQCSLCHQPLTSFQGELCIACHIQVGEQVLTGNSMHGSIGAVRQCAECHSDHLGRDFDLRLGHLDSFDHSGTEFLLTWHQVDYSMSPINCLNCHVADGEFSVSTKNCAACHAGSDMDFMIAHFMEFGDRCIDCHDGKDTMASFDHSQAAFPLEGSHIALRCVDCHNDAQFADLASTCSSCHGEPGLHLGQFSLTCEECHDSFAWSPAILEGRTFAHAGETNFNLVKHRQDAQGGLLNCRSCHSSIWSDINGQVCIQCHSETAPEFISDHRVQLGDDCVDCHDGVDRMMSFDHNVVFPLDGKHNQADCRACHINYVYQDTPDKCKDCHLEPQVHAGFFGLKCEYCHKADSWYPGKLHIHKFPINHGGQNEAECALCHPAVYQDYSCFECHDHQLDEIKEGHRELGLRRDELVDCFACHEDGLVHEINERQD